jgi:thiol:disulfide interchange protein DsbA
MIPTRTMSRTIALLLTVLCTGSIGAQSQGAKQYEEIRPPQPTSAPNQIEVVEMFWYGCPHCYTFEPYIERWLGAKPNDVTFVRVPAVFSAGWEPHARAYYAAETLGVLDKVHRSLFDAIHRDRAPLQDEKSLARFFAARGVPEQDFHKAYDSFAVNGKVARANQLTHDYQITGVPAVIVNGKYRTSATLAGGYENLLKVVNELIERERTAAVAATTTPHDIRYQTSDIR